MTWVCHWRRFVAQRPKPRWCCRRRIRQSSLWLCSSALEEHSGSGPFPGHTLLDGKECAGLPCTPGHTYDRIWGRQYGPIQLDNLVPMPLRSRSLPPVKKFKQKNVIFLIKLHCGIIQTKCRRKYDVLSVYLSFCEIAKKLGTLIEKALVTI